MAAPQQAKAEEPTQIRYLSSMVVDLVQRVETSANAEEHIIHVDEDAAEEPAIQDRSQLDLSFVQIFGRGLDVSAQLSEESTTGSVVVQVKPNFGKRGGILRCTFRF